MVRMRVNLEDGQSVKRVNKCCSTGFFPDLFDGTYSNGRGGVTVFKHLSVLVGFNH